MTALAIGGRMFTTGNFANIFIYTSEVYPTIIRYELKTKTSFCLKRSFTALEGKILYSYRYYCV